jgi:XTP/dITP diphosphohydrolase
VRKLLVATHNQGKLHELSGLLSGVSVQILSLTDLGRSVAVEEHGTTFESNAVHKTVEYSRLGDALTLADDSGLEVSALGGAPGIRSARYGGPGLSDEQRCRALLDALQKVPWDDRKARFVCVLALARGGSLIRTFRGVVEGIIAFEPRGAGGFGYDPIFYYPPLSRTFGELRREEKEKVSHRGQALREFVAYMESTH